MLWGSTLSLYDCFLIQMISSSNGTVGHLVCPVNEELSIVQPIFNVPLIVSPPRCEALAAELGMIELLSTASTAWPPSAQLRGRGDLTGTASLQR